MQDEPKYDDVVQEVYDYLIARRDVCLNAGIHHNRICLDPGIGFGKSHQHNLELLRATKRFAEIGSPLLIGHSRKGFIGKLLGDKEADRMAATAGISDTIWTEAAMYAVAVCHIIGISPAVIGKALAAFKLPT